MSQLLQAPLALANNSREVTKIRSVKQHQVVTTLTVIVTTIILSDAQQFNDLFADQS